MTRRSRRSRRLRRSRRSRRSWRWGGVAALATTVIVAAVLSRSPDRRPAPPDVEPADRPDGRVRVEVLNAGGIRWMARDATRRLRPVGFDVVHFGNAGPSDAGQPSVVIDRVGRTDVAQAVAEALGIHNVQSEPDPNLYVDVSVLLGSEWARPAAAGTADTGTAGRAWWDPRGWLGR